MVVIRMVESINKSLPKQIQDIVLLRMYDIHPPNIAIKHENLSSYGVEGGPRHSPPPNK